MSSTETSATGSSALRILIAEDEALIRTDLAEMLGCSRQAVKNLQYGRVTRIRPSLAAAIDAVASQPPSCAVCDDVDTVLITTRDPQVIAERLNTTTVALPVGTPAFFRNRT